MSRPVIGITPLYDYNLNSWWMIPGYAEAVQASGGIPVVLPFSDDREATAELVSKLDGFIFTGGPDSNPNMYGEEMVLQLGMIDSKRDVNEKLIYELVREADKPALGVCRGHQLINILEGGTLYQDLPSMKPSETRHSQRQPNYILTHRVDIAESTPLMDWMDGAKKLEVNSYHHQAIKDLAPGLKVMALSSEDGIIEAFYHPERRFTVGIQWHPELAYKDHPVHQRIFQALVDAAK